MGAEPLMPTVNVARQDSGAVIVAGGLVMTSGSHAATAGATQAHGRQVINNSLIHECLDPPPAGTNILPRIDALKTTEGDKFRAKLL
jgi:hypothetical protein